MPASMLYNLYQHQENEWEKFVTSHIGDNSVLFDASSDVLDSRIYQFKNRAIKIRKIRNDCNSKQNFTGNTRSSSIWITP